MTEPPRASKRSAVDRLFTSALHDERVAAWLGLALGVTFGIAFVTGVYSHLAQHPPAWFTLPARPAGLYRVTQGLHVATGIASIPLLLAKLWVVLPKLFRWPPFTSVAHLVERLLLLPLVAGSLFLLFTGLANINLWYPWRFNFPIAHYWAAWITIGALLAHVGAKSAATRAALQPTRARSAVADASVAQPRAEQPDDPGREYATSRRQFLVAVLG